MCKQIILPPSVKTEIIKNFNVDKWELNLALSYKLNSNTAKKLRAAALQRGGFIYDGPVPESFIPKCDTEFDHTKRITIQKFGIDATVIITKSTARVEFPGCDPIMMNGITTANWNALLFGVEQVINHFNSLK